MPITSKSYVNFTPYTDVENLWANKEEMNLWFQNFYINMAGICDPGVVRKASAVEYSPVDIVDGDQDYYTLNISDPDLGIVPATFVSQTRYDQLESEFLKLKAAFEALTASLINAGTLSNDSSEICV